MKNEEMKHRKCNPTKKKQESIDRNERFYGSTAKQNFVFPFRKQKKKCLAVG